MSWERHVGQGCRRHLHGSHSFAHSASIRVSHHSLPQLDRHGHCRLLLALWACSLIGVRVLPHCHYDTTLVLSVPSSPSTVYCLHHLVAVVELLTRLLCGGAQYLRSALTDPLSTPDRNSWIILLSPAGLKAIAVRTHPVGQHSGRSQSDSLACLVCPHVLVPSVLSAFCARFSCVNLCLQRSCAVLVAGCFAVRFLLPCC